MIIEAHHEIADHDRDREADADAERAAGYEIAVAKLHDEDDEGGDLRRPR